MRNWKPIERMVPNSAIWVIKYDLYQYNGQFVDKDHPNAVKFTSCHGWYANEADAYKVLNHFPNPDAYRVEKVWQRELV